MGYGAVNLKVEIRKRTGQGKVLRGKMFGWGSVQLEVLRNTNGNIYKWAKMQDELEIQI